MKPAQTTIAIVYDFDGTLSPDNMQETTVLKEYGVDKDEFWGRTNGMVNEQGYERTLAYLKLLIHDPVFQSKPLTPERFVEYAHRDIRYFKGVEEYFGQMDAFVNQMPEVQNLGIRIEHYIVSSGLKDILDGCSIAKFFKKIYACEFEYKDNRPVFPKLVINDTNKTQFLFRINKGKLEMSEDINTHMPEEERPIPFRNMIYIGDGLTDIPSMTVMQKSGGHAVAVFPPEGPMSDEIKSMVADGRADHFAPADFREDQLLVKILRKAIRKIVQNIAYMASSDRSREWVEKSKIKDHEAKN